VHQWFADRVGDRFAKEAILSAANVCVDDELSLRDRSLAVIAVLITKGAAEQQLRMHARWAIHHGSTRQELEALATLLAVYAGYPRASNELALIRDELAKLRDGMNPSQSAEHQRSTQDLSARHRAIHLLTCTEATTQGESQ
jgi:alkylhydroperoxidase/carboxymuconolactone decarboxylase family protein YurZ